MTKGQLLDNIIALQRQIDTLKKEIEKQKKFATHCEARVLCQNCANGIWQREPIVLGNGEVQKGCVACKLTAKDTCENFINFYTQDQKGNNMINFTLTKEKMKEFAELFSVETSAVKEEDTENISEERSTENDGKY